MSDKVTVLETCGPLLTKVYRSDGRTESYDNAKSFHAKVVEVGSLKGMAALLEKLKDNPKRCIIRGVPAETDLVPGEIEGTLARVNANFADQETHWLMIDIDGFKPPFSDPVQHPEHAILEFLETTLPEFVGCSYFWQLSSSAGAPGKEGILKCHVFFWSKTPYTTAQYYEWASATGGKFDRAVFRKVQVHYTAAPIFEEGRVDPVPVRSGWYQGERDEVDLRISAELLSQAREQGGGEGGKDMTLTDPSAKEGLIGAFHRAYTAEDVLLTLLEGEFEQVTSRRYTWVNGGGTPEGVWVHDDGMHVGSSHNTWPIKGIANLWDLFRVFKFGHLDTAEPGDDFGQLDLDNTPVHGLPSHQAALEWAQKEPRLASVAIAEHTAALEAWLLELSGINSTYIIEQSFLPRVRAAELSVADRARIVDSLQTRFASLGARLTRDEVRRLVRPGRESAGDTLMPEEIGKWVWVTSIDRFIHCDHKEIVTITSFNALYDRTMGPFADENGIVPKASDMALRVWGVDTCNDTEYNPAIKSIMFKRDGRQYLNTYRPELLPQIPHQMLPEHHAAVDTLLAHTELLIPNERERNIFLDYLAFCVQQPGRKVRWAPLLIGMEGDGKTAFTVLMGLVLGPRNCRVLNNSTLESQFTGWATGQHFIGVEELKLHNQNKVDIYNNLKPIISNDQIEVHPKGRDPYNVPNVANLLMLTNFDDAVPISRNDRRVFFIRSPFYGAGVETLAAAIKVKTGLTLREFHHQLFDIALKKHAGALRRWFLERAISPDFDPDGRAPETSMRDVAVDLSSTDIEVAISGVLEEGGVGIYPTLASTSHVTAAVRDRYELDPRGHTVSVAMGKLGWTNYGKPVRWGKKVLRWYYKGTCPSNVATEASRLEAIRLEKEVNDGFAD